MINGIKKFVSFTLRYQKPSLSYFKFKWGQEFNLLYKEQINKKVNVLVLNAEAMEDAIWVAWNFKNCPNKFYKF